MKKFIFPGSFDPFTNGHKAIVDQTYKLCDEFYIALATNLSKKGGLIPREDRVKIIEDIFKDYPNVKVIDISGQLISEYCKEHDIEYIVRGVRNSNDFEYEKNLAATNHELSKVNTLLVFGFCKPDLISISSTFVRELVHYKLDISNYVPKAVTDYIEKNNITY